MKAILMNTAGNADVLQLQEIAKPELPSTHHVRVKLVAVGIKSNACANFKLPC